MKIAVGNAQFIGDREEQQDTFGFSDIRTAAAGSRHGLLAVLCDGMGGENFGAQAAASVVKTVLNAYPRWTRSARIPDALQQAIVEAQEAVHLVQAALPGAKRAGSTIVSAVVRGDELFWAAAGDSRAYLLRDGCLHQLNTDHVFQRELERRRASGELTDDEVWGNPDRQALTSFLGRPGLGEIDRNRIPLRLRAGDRILLCSDGLYRSVDLKEIARVASTGAPQLACEQLIRRVRAKGAPEQDNVTVLLLAPELRATQETALVSWKRLRFPLYGFLILLVVIELLVLLVIRFPDRSSFSSAATADTAREDPADAHD